VSTNLRVFVSLRDYFLKPPYAGLPWLAFLFAVVPCFFYTMGGPFDGRMIGFDDQVRMVQVLQWLDGGSWHDRLITRVNAPEGFETIWSRLVDLPIAAVIVVARWFTDEHTATLAASVVVPMVALILMFYAARYYARPVAGKREAWLVILFVMFTSALNPLSGSPSGFHLGEASHHAWYGILNTVMFGAVLRLVLGAPGRGSQLTFAISCALLLAIGVEPLPIIAGMVVLLAALAFSYKNAALAQRSTQALALATLISLLLVPSHMPFARWFEISFVQPSILGPILLATATFYMAVMWFAFAGVSSEKSRSFIVVGLAIFMTALTLHFLPQLRGGALSGLSPNERILASQEHVESWPMHRVMSDSLTYISYIMPTLIALTGGVMSFRRSSSPRRRRILIAAMGIVSVTGLLAQIYWRYIHHALMAGCPLLLRTWQHIRARLKPHKYYAPLAFGAFIVLAPLWMIYVPAWRSHTLAVTDWFLFSAKLYTQKDSCASGDFTRYLNAHYPPETNILVPDWDSATFLYETNLHIDFLANFPSHDHFIDNKIFFGTQDIAQSEDIAHRHNIDLVAVCAWSPEYMGIVAAAPNPSSVTFQRLREGYLKKQGALPDWIHPIYLPVRTNYLLFGVDKSVGQHH
jgi:hypothetical protein